MGSTITSTNARLIFRRLNSNSEEDWCLVGQLMAWYGGACYEWEKRPKSVGLIFGGLTGFLVTHRC